MSKLLIKKIGVLSAAKMYGAMMFVISLIIAIPYGLILIIWGLVGGSTVGGDAGLAVGGGGLIAGVMIMILLPIFYGVIGFVFGAISALVYNLFSGMIGGLEIEVENIA